jgi:hypothetical protein
MTAKGLYIYCVAKGDREESLDLCGIEGTHLWALTHQGLVAIVQECEPKPFASEDQKVLADWLLTHQNIMDRAWERYETIIPFGFDTIIVPTSEKLARQNLNEWLEKESAELKRKLEDLKNKAEYGAQVLWDPTVILPRIREEDAEMQHLEKEIRSKPGGVAYLLQKKLEALIRQRLETAADAYFKAFYQQIRECVENVHIEKIRKEDPPKQMILNVSCLQNRDEMAALGTVLDKIGQIPGFDVRFTGPWPPYSFVGV